MDQKLQVLYEDEDVVAIDKPAGVSTHPAPGEKDISLSEVVAKYLDTDIDNQGMDLVVHRLDKGTSGVILFAKNQGARAALKKQFADRSISKTYLTLVSGVMETSTGKIDIPLGRNINSRGRFDPKVEGKPAVTEFNVIKGFLHFTYLAAMPKTGRTHQIRTHFSAIGHPVAGDKRYGYVGNEFPRIFLHAASITFESPQSGVKTIKSALPEELSALLTRIN